MSSLVRHVNAVSPSTADGVLAEVYRQVNAEFSTIGPDVQMMSPAPELVTAGWALMREAQLVGDAPMLGKAMVALGVAQSLDCQYDAVALLAMLRIVGATELAAEAETGGTLSDPELAAIIEWARTTGSDLPTPVPADGDIAAQYIGTALLTHFIDRMSDAMLPAGLLPGSMRAEDEPACEGAPVFQTPKSDHQPGLSLPLLDGNPVGEFPVWAGDSPIGKAYACLAATAAQGAGLLSKPAQTAVSEAIAAHRHRRPDGHTGWLEKSLAVLSTEDQAGARVAILAGLDPRRIAGDDVVCWRAVDPRFSDHCTVYLLAYGAMSAVGHIEAALSAA